MKLIGFQDAKVLDWEAQRIYEELHRLRHRMNDVVQGKISDKLREDYEFNHRWLMYVNGEITTEEFMRK